MSEEDRKRKGLERRAAHFVHQLSVARHPFIVPEDDTFSRHDVLMYSSREKAGPPAESYSVVVRPYLREAAWGGGGGKEPPMLRWGSTGGGGNGGNMEERMRSVEDRVTRLEEKVDHGFANVGQRFTHLTERMDGRFDQLNSRFDTLETHYARREDVANARLFQTLWTVGTMIILVGVVLGVVKYL